MRRSRTTARICSAPGPGLTWRSAQGWTWRRIAEAMFAAASPVIAAGGVVDVPRLGLLVRPLTMPSSAPVGLTLRLVLELELALLDPALSGRRRSLASGFAGLGGSGLATGSGSAGAGSGSTGASTGESFAASGSLLGAGDIWSSPTLSTSETSIAGGRGSGRLLLDRKPTASSANSAAWATTAATRPPISPRLITARSAATPCRPRRCR
ncbi:MAG: hypothetical protein WDN24_06005 [Sphingomonas sp.]